MISYAICRDTAILDHLSSGNLSPAQHRSPMAREPIRTSQAMTGTYVRKRGHAGLITPIQRSADLANDAHVVLS